MGSGGWRIGKTNHSLSDALTRDKEAIPDCALLTPTLSKPEPCSPPVRGRLHGLAELPWPLTDLQQVFPCLNFFFKSNSKKQGKFTIQIEGILHQRWIVFGHQQSDLHALEN